MTFKDEFIQFKALPKRRIRKIDNRIQELEKDLSVVKTQLENSKTFRGFVEKLGVFLNSFRDKNDNELAQIQSGELGKDLQVALEEILDSVELALLRLLRLQQREARLETKIEKLRSLSRSLKRKKGSF